MKNHFFLKLFFALFIVVMNSFAFANDITNPCSGLLAIINRPYLTGSACALPKKQILVEGGYQYLNLTGNAQGYVTPQAIVRFGLPSSNEFVIILPSFYHQTYTPRAGWSAVSLSLKHEIGYNERWVGAVEGILGAPTGSSAFGSRAYSETVNGIATYTLNSLIGITGTLGVSSTSVQFNQNGKRFTSVNPDIFASYQSTDKLQLFLELYAQTRTGAGEGLGLLTVGGFYYLLTPRIALDAEVGQRVTGQWGFQSYSGVGGAVLFG